MGIQLAVCCSNYLQTSCFFLELKKKKLNQIISYHNYSQMLKSKFKINLVSFKIVFNFLQASSLFDFGHLMYVLVVWSAGFYEKSLFCFSIKQKWIMSYSIHPIFFVAHILWMNGCHISRDGFFRLVTTHEHLTLLFWLLIKGHYGIA